MVRNYSPSFKDFFWNWSSNFSEKVKHDVLEKSLAHSPITPGIPRVKNSPLVVSVRHRQFQESCAHPVSHPVIRSTKLKRNIINGDHLADIFVHVAKTCRPLHRINYHHWQTLMQLWSISTCSRISVTLFSYCSYTHIKPRLKWLM